MPARCHAAPAAVRTSWGTFLPQSQDEVVYAIEHQIANWMHLPVSHVEDIQVLRYSNNQTCERGRRASGQGGGVRREERG